MYREKKINREFKKGVSADEARRDRHSAVSELRVSRRQNTLQQRRRIDPNEEEYADTIDASPEAIGQNLRFLTSQNYEEVLTGVRYFRRILSFERNPPIGAIIDMGVCPSLIALLNYPENTVVFEAAWALTNIATGNTEQTKQIVDLNVIPMFSRLLFSESDEVRDQAVWALGNIAGDSVPFRDEALKNGALLNIVKLCSNGSIKLSLLRNCAWTLSNLCRLKPAPAFSEISAAVEILSVMLDMADLEVVTDACWSFSYILDIPSSLSESQIFEIHQKVIQSKAVERLIRRLALTSVKSIVPAVRAIGNLISGPDTSIEVAIRCKYLDHVVGLLQAQSSTVRKETTWTISNIAASSSDDHIARLIESPGLQYLFTLAPHADPNIAKEIGWTIFNLLCKTRDQVLGRFPIRTILDTIMSILLRIEHEIQKNLLLIFSQLLAAYKSQVIEYLQETENGHILESLQHSKSEEVADIASRIIKNELFGKEVHDNQYAHQHQNQGHQDRYNF